MWLQILLITAFICQWYPNQKWFQHLHLPILRTPQPPIVISGNIQITTIFFNGVVSSYEPDEYVEIKNFDTRSIQVEGWTLRDIAEHVYIFPYFVMAPNQTCRIYTNQNHPEFCSFNYESGQAIWNNTGDTAYLRDSSGNPIDEYRY